LPRTIQLSYVVVVVVVVVVAAAVVTDMTWSEGEGRRRAMVPTA
jgi:hypothetical protein